MLFSFTSLFHPKACIISVLTDRHLKNQLNKGLSNIIMQAKCQQISESLIAHIQCQLFHIFCEWLYYTRYSTQNDKIMTTLPRYFSTINGQLIFVLSNYIRIPTIKLSIHIENNLSRIEAKSHIGSLGVTQYPVLKLQDLVMPLVKSKKLGHSSCLNCSCVTCLRLQLQLVIYSLFLHDNSQILQQNAKFYYYTPMLSNLLRPFYQRSQSVRNAPLDILI